MRDGALWPGLRLAGTSSQGTSRLPLQTLQVRVLSFSALSHPFH